MDTAAARELAAQIEAQERLICRRVAGRLLAAFPELRQSLRLEENYPPIERLSQVAVERLSRLICAVLIFELPSLANQELGWTRSTLPRSGVRQEHQMMLVRWFFEEVRGLPIGPPELATLREVEEHFLSQMLCGAGES